MREMENPTGVVKQIMVSFSQVARSLEVYGCLSWLSDLIISGLMSL